MINEWIEFAFYSLFIQWIFFFFFKNQESRIKNFAFVFLKFCCFCFFPSVLLNWLMIEFYSRILMFTDDFYDFFSKNFFHLNQESKSFLFFFPNRIFFLTDFFSLLFLAIINCLTLFVCFQKIIYNFTMFFFHRIYPKTLLTYWMKDSRERKKWWMKFNPLVFNILCFLLKEFRSLFFHFFLLFHYLHTHRGIIIFAVEIFLRRSSFVR